MKRIIAGWIEVNVWAEQATENKVSIQISSISQIESMGDHGSIVRVDGGSLETVENLPTLRKMISEA